MNPELPKVTTQEVQEVLRLLSKDAEISIFALSTQPALTRDLDTKYAIGFKIPGYLRHSFATPEQAAPFIERKSSIAHAVVQLLLDRMQGGFQFPLSRILWNTNGEPGQPGYDDMAMVMGAELGLPIAAEDMPVLEKAFVLQLRAWAAKIESDPQLMHAMIDEISQMEPEEIRRNGGPGRGKRPFADINDVEPLLEARGKRRHWRVAPPPTGDEKTP